MTPGSAAVQGSSTVSPAVKQFTNAQAQVAQGTASPAEVKTAAASPSTIVSGPGSGAYATFDTTKSTAITVKIGLSFVSTANAKQNVNSGKPNWELQYSSEEYTAELGSEVG